MAKGIEKDQLIAREVNTQANHMKNKIEQALYTEDSSELTQEEFENLFSPLAKIGRRNEQLEEMGVKVEAKRNKKTEDKLKYYNQKDGSKRFDESKDGSLRVQREIRELDTRIHGPAVDVMDLINNIKRNR